MRMHIVLVLIASLGLWTTEAIAQRDNLTPPDWSIYIVQTVVDDVLRFDADGTIIQYDTGVRGNEILIEDNLAITSAGLAAMCVHTDGEDGLPAYEFRLRDLALADEVMAPIEFGTAYDCNLANGLSPDETQIAVSVLHNYGTEESLNPDDPLWSVYIIDLITSDIVDQLSEADEVADTYSRAPQIFNNDEQQVMFQTQPRNSASTTHPLISLRWDRTAGTLTEVAPSDVYAAQFTQSGTVMMQNYTGINVIDLPTPDLSITPGLTVNEAESNTHIGAAPVLAAATVDNGESIALYTYQASFGGMPEQHMFAWERLDGNNETTTLVPATQYAQLVGIPSGYAVFERMDEAPGKTMTLTIVVDSEAREIFRWHGEAFRANWVIKRVTPQVLPSSNLTFTTP